MKKEKLASILANAAMDECYRMWRLARKAEKHHVSNYLVNAIREEGWRLYNIANVYDSHRVLSENFIWAFRGGELLWES